MTKYEIVEELGKKKVVEKIAKHFKTFARQDLSQYVYVYLLEKMDENKLIELYKNNKIKQFISGIIYRQVVSNHSEYIKTYARQGLSTDAEAFEGHSHSDNLIDYNEQPHQYEDDVDEFISELTPEEQSLIWLNIIPLTERMEDIKIWCKEHNYTYRQYQGKLVALKNKVRKAYGQPLLSEIPRTSSPLSKTTKVKFTDADGNQTIFKNRRECVLELKKIGYCADAIYKSLAGKKKHYRNCKFEFID